MKKIIILLWIACMLVGCRDMSEQTSVSQEEEQVETTAEEVE